MKDLEEPLVPFYMPTLVDVLQTKETEKGSPLSEQEVLEIRDRATRITVGASFAESAAKERGKDLDPDNLWEEWQRREESMGDRLSAFIEYERPVLGEKSPDPPFSKPTDSVVPLDEFVDLWAGKDYRFFSCIAGRVWREGKPGPFPARGLPEPVYWRIEEEIDDSVCVSWLNLLELREALDHCGLAPDDLSLAVQFVIASMEFLGKKVGEGRVRLVFGIE